MIEPEGEVTVTRSKRILLPLAALLAGLAGCGGEESSDSGPISPFPDAALDKYALGLMPEVSDLMKLSGLNLKPLVMVNLHRYRDKAVGKGFEGMTGKQAYSKYISSITAQQNNLGTRTISLGEVDTQVVGKSDPVFHAVALPEYVEAKAFLSLATTMPAEGSAARTAGLEGQWLVAARTVSEDVAALGDGSNCATWSARNAADATGLSSAPAPARASLQVHWIYTAATGAGWF